MILERVGLPDSPPTSSFYGVDLIFNIINKRRSKYLDPNCCSLDI